MPARTHVLSCYYIIHLLYRGWSSPGCSVSMWSLSGTLGYKQAPINQIHKHHISHEISQALNAHCSAKRDQLAYMSKTCLIKGFQQSQPQLRGYTAKTSNWTHCMAVTAKQSIWYLPDHWRDCRPCPCGYPVFFFRISAYWTPLISRNILMKGLPKKTACAHKIKCPKAEAGVIIAMNWLLASTC